MSLLNRKSFPSGPFSVFFSPGGGDSHWKTFLYQPSFNWNEEERGENWQKMFEPKISVEPNRAPKHRSNKKTGSLLLRRCRNFNQIEKKISEKDKKRNEPNPILDFKNFGWSWLQLHFQSSRHDSWSGWVHIWRHFFRPGRMAEHQRWPCWKELCKGFKN